ncbi:MAG: SulP family inorganic anion transporter, partial [Pseudorhodobacter sp.]
MILGIDALGHCLAMATLCFAAGLTAGLGFAVSAFALSSAIVTLVLMHKSGFRSALGICQDTSIALLAPAVIFAASRSTGGLESQIATAFAVIGLSTILSGLAFLLVGNHRLGRIVRLFPYPVAAGFLASSGWLLLFAALTISTGAESFSSVVTHAATSEAARNLFPALALALGLLAAMRFGAGTTGLLVVLMSFVFGFYLCMWAWGIDQQDAISLGFLPKIQNLDSEVSFWSLPAQVNWVLVAQTLPVIAAVVALNLVGLLLNTSGVELATHQDVDANHELQISGWANLLVGTFGGLTGFITSGSSILATRLTQNKMALQLSYIAVMLLGCVLASQIVAIIPSFVAAGLLMFIGLSMLGDWLIASFHRMVPGDWAVVIGIVGLTAAFGILPAIAIGVLGAVFLFAYRYARLPVIRYETDGIRRRSTVDRSAEDEQLLTNHGARILIMHLQGALFFGSIDMLISRIRSDLSKSTGPQILILDFASVTAIDAATCAAIQRLRHVVATKGAVLHISGISRDVSAVFE